MHVNMNMASVSKIRLLVLLIIFYPVFVSVVWVKNVESVIPCSNKEKIVSAEIYATESSSFLIRICGCNGYDIVQNSFRKLTVAQKSCEFPVIRIEINWNTFGHYCVLSKPIAIDLFRYNGLILCPASGKKTWNTAVVLKSTLRPPANRSTPDMESIVSTRADFRPAVIKGLRVEETAEKEVSYEDGVSAFLAGTLVAVRLFGYDFSETSEFRFVFVPRERGSDCEDLPFTVTIHLNNGSLTTHSSLVHFRLPIPDQMNSANSEGESSAFYVCSLERLNGWNRWIHQGKEPGLKLRTYQRSLPLWIQVAIIIILLSLSGLFSGLNLGLMALDRTELKIYKNIGLERERRFAKTVIPIRNRGNYLLCTLLLGNVLFNSTLTILLDDLTSGIIAIIGSTLGIVIFGEIIPQSLCSRFGLAIGAHTVWITKFFMLITFPMAYPISLVLDRILGKEVGAFYDRERLKELIKVTNEYHGLEKEEVNIIAGALEFRRKTVGDIMTRLDDVFMLNCESVLDFETVTEIVKQGFSRIPVYEEERSNIIALLFIKELALVDPDDATPLKTLCRFYKNRCNFVFEDTTLDVIFNEFKEGHKGHMAFVQRVNCEGEGDPFYETVGLVTLEDVIEELIQDEIVDETDTWVDNRSKRLRENSCKVLLEFSNFAVWHRVKPAHKISPQLALATFQFLTSSVDPFKTEWISKKILLQLIQQSSTIRYICVKKKQDLKSDRETLLFQKGNPADYFVLILEGRVEVTVGNENLFFESGPFSHFGAQALTSSYSSVTGESPSANQLFRASAQSMHSPVIDKFDMGDSGRSAARGLTFVVDYTVRAVSNLVYFHMSRSLYQAVRSATVLERIQREFVQRTTECECAFLSKREDSDTSVNLTKGFLPTELQSEIIKSSEKSPINIRPNYGTVQEEWSHNSRCNSDCLLTTSNPEKESLLNGSLLSTPNTCVVDSRYKRNEVFSSCSSQTIINHPNETGNESFSHRSDR